MEKEKSAKIAFGVIGFILGIIIFIMGISTMNSKPESRSTSYTDSYSFGADFYTEEYEATKNAADNAAVTANNVRELGNTITNCFGTLLIAVGLIVCLYSLKEAVVVGVTASGDKPAAQPSVEKAPEVQPIFTQPYVDKTDVDKTAVDQTAVAEPAAVIADDREPGSNEWKCPKCGTIHQNYVGTCGCGETKPR